MKALSKAITITAILAFAGFGVFTALGQEVETRTFGYWEDDSPRPDSMEGVVFRPNPDADQAFLLYLESSMDLETWEIEGLQSYQVNDDGTIVATGDDAIDRKFWRLRILHPNAHPIEDWLAVLKVSRAETSVTAALTVRTNYHPFIKNYIQYSIDLLPVEWDPTLENLDSVNAATFDALTRLMGIVEEVQPADGDYYEATRPIE